MAKSSSVQELSDKIKAILADPELLAKLAERELEDGSVSVVLDELETSVAELEQLYPTSK